MALAQNRDECSSGNQFTEKIALEMRTFRKMKWKRIQHLGVIRRMAFLDFARLERRRLETFQFYLFFQNAPRSMEQKYDTMLSRRIAQNAVPFKLDIVERLDIDLTYSCLKT